VKKIHVLYSDEQQYAVADSKVKDWYAKILAKCKDSDNVIVHVATAIQLNELRVGVRLGELECFDIEFNGKTIRCGVNGKLDEWPINFFDQMSIQIRTLMKGKAPTSRNQSTKS
tara:strand:- start:763 stop:1104 length:342 start_codon:yes stop_codon:yes gene_type:complete